MTRFRKSVGLVLAGLPMLVGAVDLGTVGALFPIEERDALEEIQARAAAVDWPARLASIRPERAFVVAPLALPRAEVARVRQAIPNYVLPFDLPGKDGAVLYPKGYRFNPLAYANVPLRLAAFDGADPDQVDWARHLVTNEGWDAPTLLATGGDARALGALVGKPVFGLTRAVADLLQLERVPALLASRGEILEIREVVLPMSKQEEP